MLHLGLTSTCLTIKVLPTTVTERIAQVRLLLPLVVAVVGVVGVVAVVVDYHYNDHELTNFGLVGFVSMSWEGMKPGWTTETLPGVAHPIDKTELKEGMQM